MLYFKPVKDNEKEAARIFAIDGENELGSCYVCVDAYKCFVSEIAPKENDSLLIEGLIRSALNFAANRGAYIAECSQAEFKSVLELLGFENKDGIYKGEIPELLKGQCCKSSK